MCIYLLFIILKKKRFFFSFWILAKWYTKINKFYVFLKSLFHIYHKFYNTKFKFLLEALCKKNGIFKMAYIFLLILSSFWKMDFHHVWSMLALLGFRPPRNVQYNEIWYISWVLWNDQLKFRFIKNREGINKYIIIFYAWKIFVVYLFLGNEIK